MSVPKLTTSDGSTYTVTCTRGHQFPYAYHSDVPNQVQELTRDRLAIVRKNGGEQKYSFISLHGETSTVATAIYVLFSSTYVDHMMNTFRYYPDKDSGSYYTMRLTKTYDSKMIDSVDTERLYDIKIYCKEE